MLHVPLIGFPYRFYVWDQEKRNLTGLVLCKY